MAQQPVDTSMLLDEVTISGIRVLNSISRLEAVSGTYIYSGKKNEVIRLGDSNVALTEKHGRQVFAKVPGVFVYDMDGTGNQLNIATRGLDPHRGWEFNIRKDGVLTNSDMYGYPASHYNIPLEAVEQIELVRGTGSLQYGAQFGGLLNFKTKDPDTSKALTFESINTVGSYGLVSTFNSASGKIGKFRYSAWLTKKQQDGYRRNNDSEYDAQAISLFYDASDNLTLKLEYTRSYYQIHIAGPLTDSMFALDPRASTRSRNFYSPEIHIPSFKLNWDLSPNTRIEWISSWLTGSRNSVLYDRPATIPDTINAETLEFNNRQIDIDNFNSFTSELRLRQHYALFTSQSTLSAGLQFMNNNLHRRQRGLGTTGEDYDLSVLSTGFQRDMNFKTRNLALFAENRWVLSPKLSVNTGMRIEIGASNLTGVLTYFPEDDFPRQISHTFPLFGVSAEYQIDELSNLYGGWSQAYRPVLFKDIVPASIFEFTDPDLEDAFGYNAEIGYRGTKGRFKWDVTGFMIRYNNRMGTLAQRNTAGDLIIFRTNIGDARTVGLEFFAQHDFSLSNKVNLSLFSSSSYMDGRYLDAVLRSGEENINVRGNKLESVPEWIFRNGLTIQYDNLSLSVLHSYTASTFADPFNTVEPVLSGAVGLVPEYHLLDFNFSARISPRLRLLLNVNNALNLDYFTKRPQLYPGPGVWPSDGRTISATAFLRL